jgi:hypothetical protein
VYIHVIVTSDSSSDAPQCCRSKALYSRKNQQKWPIDPGFMRSNGSKRSIRVIKIDSVVLGLLQVRYLRACGGSMWCHDHEIEDITGEARHSFTKF